MSIFLKRYHNMVITPQDDRILFDSIFDDYGLIYGGSAVMSASNKIHVGNARGFIKGSEVIIEDDDIAVELSDSGSKPGRLKIVVDYSDSSNPVKFESEVADSFPSLEQDNNINHTNGRYEVVFATYTAAETVISDVHLVMPTMRSVKEKLVALNTDMPAFGPFRSVTLPYTAKRNCFLQVFFTCNSTVSCLYLKSEKFGYPYWSWCSYESQHDMGVSQIIPVCAGDTISVYLTRNITPNFKVTDAI